MTDLAKFVEDSQTELESKVAEMESEFLDNLIYEYLADFETENGELTQSINNYNKINRSNSVFDEAFNTIMIAFLLQFGNKILEGVHKSVAHFHDIGVKASYSEVAFVEKEIGLVGGKLVKGGYLWNLGQMGELRQQFQTYLMRAVSTGQKTNLFLRNIKPIFKSNKDKESIFARYYRKYAYDSIAQTMNTISLYIADKNGLTEFLYAGGLVKDSRAFCIERAGNIYTREEAKPWDEMHWKGKIPEVPFLIQCGGFSCIHTIVWLNNK